MIVQGGVEFFRRGKTEAARQSAELFGILGHGMGLLFGLDLKPVFDAAQKPVSVFERARFPVRQELQVRQDR